MYHLEKPAHISSTGIQLFYNIIENMNEVCMKFTPLHEFYEHILTELAVSI